MSEIAFEQVETADAHFCGQVVVSRLGQGACLRMVGSSPSNGRFIVRNDAGRHASIVGRAKDVGNRIDADGSPIVASRSPVL